MFYKVKNDFEELGLVLLGRLTSTYNKQFWKGWKVRNESRDESKFYCLNTYFILVEVNFRAKLNVKSNIYSKLISHFVREKVITAKTGGQISIHCRVRIQTRQDRDNILPTK